MGRSRFSPGNGQLATGNAILTLDLRINADVPASEVIAKNTCSHL